MGERTFKHVCPFKLASSYILAAKSDFPLSLWFQNQRPRHVIDLLSEIETTYVKPPVAFKLGSSSRREMVRTYINRSIRPQTGMHLIFLQLFLPQLIRRHTPSMIDVAMYMQVSPREVPYKTPLDPLPKEQYQKGKASTLCDRLNGPHSTEATELN